MYRQPPFLKKNDTVAIIATAKNFDRKEILAAAKIIEGWGLKVVFGKNLFHKDSLFAGNDQERLRDLQWALDTNYVKAIFCARGGYGTARIIDEVNFKEFRKNPKWVVGFSDVTTLLSAILSTKTMCIHGPMPIQFSNPHYAVSLNHLRKALFGEAFGFFVKSNFMNRKGTCKGKLVGGNLTILCSMIGTSTELKTKDKLLFIEEVGEHHYRIDRLMRQLKRAGMLKSIKGLVVGHFSDMQDDASVFGKSVYEIIEDTVREYKYPVLYDFPAGHKPDNLPLILGSEYSLKIR